MGNKPEVVLVKPTPEEVEAVHDVLADKVAERVVASLAKQQHALAASMARGIGTAVAEATEESLAKATNELQRKLQRENGMFNGNADEMDQILNDLEKGEEGAVNRAKGALAKAAEADSSWAPRATKSHISTAVIAHTLGFVGGVATTAAAVGVYNWYTADADEFDLEIEQAKPRVVNG